MKECRERERERERVGGGGVIKGGGDSVQYSS
jgi:hypothetical protein